MEVMLHSYCALFTSKINVKICSFCLAEESLRQAEEISSILYKKNVEVLMKLSPDDFSTVFEGAEVVPLMMKPGTTILELAMGAKCFETEGNC